VASPNKFNNTVNVLAQGGINFALDNLKMLSDHRDASFGSAYGTLIKELRILSRAIFVVDPENRIKYVEYVPEVADFPNYEAALEAAKS